MTQNLETEFEHLLGDLKTNEISTLNKLFDIVCQLPNEQALQKLNQIHQKKSIVYYPTN